MEKEKTGIMEYVWIGVGILSVSAGIHKTIKHGFINSYWFFVMALTCVLLFFFRRYIRRNRKD